MVLRVVTFKIEPDLLEQIDYIALQYRQARSEIIRKALSEYVAKERKKFEKQQEDLQLRVYKFKL